MVAWYHLPLFGHSWSRFETQYKDNIKPLGNHDIYLPWTYQPGSSTNQISERAIPPP